MIDHQYQPTLEQTPHGRWRVRTVEDPVNGPVCIEVALLHRSSRIVESPLSNPHVVGRYWCYLTLQAAVEAALGWDGLTGEPANYWRHGGAALAHVWDGS